MTLVKRYIKYNFAFLLHQKELTETPVLVKADQTKKFELHRNLTIPQRNILSPTKKSLLLLAHVDYLIIISG